MSLKSGWRKETINGNCQLPLAKLEDAPPTAFKVSHHAMQTRGITVSSTRSAVFNTLELLENILMRLPEEEIIQVRRVNRHWNAAILSSRQLLRKLFLLSEPKGHLVVFDTKTGKFRKYSSEDDLNSREIIRTGVINPMLFKKLPAHKRGTLKQRYEVCETLVLRARPSLKKQDSIFHHMHVCMPPAKAIEFEFFYLEEKPHSNFRHYGDYRIRIKVSTLHGVRFKHVLDAFVKIVGPGTSEKPSEEYKILVRTSRIWMLGVMFPSAGEMEGLIEELEGESAVEMHKKG